MPVTANYTKFYKQIGYTFKEPKLLKRALTHRSAAREHNERLEYLGDAVLGMLIAKTLYHRFPTQPEGKLTRMRASLVKGETLAALGKEMGIGELLNLGPGEMKSGGHRRGSILADAVEAIIGAIYLEAGIDTCEKLVTEWFSTRIEKLDPNAHPKDHKTRLQEFLQGRKQPLPNYEISDISGKSHDQTFTVTCSVTLLNDTVTGTGNSRRRAEQDAAKQALEQLSNVR
ncbi:ribonuclease III [Aestuariibacter salexigens]|uniref:ribonuclease III n=1 Tax=Aestuariibacter salexigens TaxID=226010 RepID=UPI0003FE289F|nr:ribonuclease III [Aestuariibacter salexigens]